MAGYGDRDGKIWMDGEMVEWRDAKVHVLSHALHYASSVFEGERCYEGEGLIGFVASHRRSGARVARSQSFSGWGTVGGHSPPP